MFNLFKKKKDSVFSWLKRINKAEQPQAEINSFHFGILEFEDTGYSLYLTGSSKYGKDEEWYCFSDFTPKEKYFNLKEQFEKVYSSEEWKDVLYNTEFLIREFVASPEFKKHFISKAEAITLAFDDGDLVRII